eukprot:1847943-Prymnesium_polylepis.1
MRKWEKEADGPEKAGRRKIKGLWVLAICISTGTSIAAMPISDGIALPYVTQDYWAALGFAAACSWCLLEPLLLLLLILANLSLRWCTSFEDLPPLPGAERKKEAFKAITDTSGGAQDPAAAAPALLLAGFLVAADLSSFDQAAFKRQLAAFIGLE